MDFAQAVAELGLRGLGDDAVGDVGQLGARALNHAPARALKPRVNAEYANCGHVRPLES